MIHASSCPVRPPALRPSDTVMLVSPAGPTRPERVARGVDLLTGWGLNVVVSPHAYARDGYLAGSDAERLADLNTALADPEIHAVFCTRGGYGTQRIVDGLDADAVRAYPKLVIGFSDITALHLALWRAAGLATVHGPGASWLDERTSSEESLRAAVTTTDPVTVVADPDEETATVRVPGAAVRGTLLGGNLSLLTSTLGTPHFPDLAGAILLIEDVDEAPYRVDRMLTHLRRAGVLRGLAGVAVGQFTRCADDWPVTVVEVLAERLGDLGVPVLGGLPVGHGNRQVSVPLGVPAALDVAAGTLVVEPAVHCPRLGRGPRVGHRGLAAVPEPATAARPRSYSTSR